jgi:hypothetical protein
MRVARVSSEYGILVIAAPLFASEQDLAVACVPHLRHGLVRGHPIGPLHAMPTVGPLVL